MLVILLPALLMFGAVGMVIALYLIPLIVGLIVAYIINWHTKMTNKKNIAIIVLVVAVVLNIAWAGIILSSSGTESTNNEKTDQNQSEQISEEVDLTKQAELEKQKQEEEEQKRLEEEEQRKAEEEASKKRVGDTVQVGDVRWRVQSVEDKGNTLFSSESNYPTITSDKVSNGGKFIKIMMSVANDGSDMKTINTSSFKLIDGQGREYTTSSEVLEWVPNDMSLLILDNINPGLQKDFIVLYEVPSSATDLRLEVDNLSFWANEKATIWLGI